MSLVSRLGGFAGAALLTAVPAAGAITPVGLSGIDGVTNVPLFEGSINDAGEVVFRDNTTRILLFEDGTGLSVLAQAGDPWPVEHGDRVTCAFRLVADTWRGGDAVQLIVEHARRA